MGFFEKIVYNFIDELTILDVSSIIVVYAMFLLLMLNIWTNFKILNLAQCVHTFIFIFTSAFYISLYIFNQEVLHTVFNSSFLKFAYLLNIALFLPYILYSKDKTKCNYRYLENDFVKSGTYDDYNYYYSGNDDKYAEPYTSKSKINNKCNNKQEINSWDEYENNISEDSEFNINKIIVTDNNFNDSDEIFNEKVDDDTDINYYNCHDYIREVSEQRSFREIVNGVKKVIQENNSTINEKVNLITENMLELKDGFQGAVDRIAKIFELFAVVIKKN